MGVPSREWVVRMGAFGGVGNRSIARLFDGIVAKGLAVGVLRVPDCLGIAVLKTDHDMLPVAYVIT